MVSPMMYFQFSLFLFEKKKFLAFLLYAYRLSDFDISVVIPRIDLSFIVYLMPLAFLDYSVRSQRDGPTYLPIRPIEDSLS